MSFETYVRTEPVDTDPETVATDWLANPANYRPVKANAAAAWLGGNARTMKLEAFIETGPAETLVVRSGAKTLLASLTGQDVQLDIAPGRNERILADALVALEVLDIEDLQALLIKAVREVEYPTGERVTSLRAKFVRETETADARAQVATMYQAAVDAAAIERDAYLAEIQTYENTGEGEIPVIEG